MSRLNEFMNDLTLDKIFGVVLMMLGIVLIVLGVIPAVERFMIVYNVSSSDLGAHFSLVHITFALVGLASFLSGLSIIIRSGRKKKLQSLDEDELGDL